MKRLILTASALLVAAAVAVPVFAGTQDAGVLALHVKEKTTKAVTICDTWSPSAESLPCDQYSTTGDLLTSYDVYLVVANGAAGPGIAGLSCGVEFSSNIAMFGWQICADLEFPNGDWPVSGGGNRITWVRTTNCQRTEFGTKGVHAVAGSFYLYAYSADEFRITPNRGVEPAPEMKLSDCNASESELDTTAVAMKAGRVAFGGGTGLNPCAEIPVEPTTWGRIKQQYNNR